MRSLLIEAQNGEVICLRSHSNVVEERMPASGQSAPSHGVGSLGMCVLT